MSESLLLVRLMLLLLLLLHQLVSRYISHAHSPRTIMHLQRGRYSTEWSWLIEQCAYCGVSIGRGCRRWRHVEHLYSGS